jgi:uncharacterized membrane protein
MNDIELTFREFYLYIVIGGAIFGALIGLIPLVLAKRRGKPRLGWYALIASIIAGAISGLFALVVVAIFIIVIVRGANAAPATANSASKQDEETASD